MKGLPDAEALRALRHELRTPLTSLLAYAELMGEEEERADPEAVARFVAAVDRNAQRELELLEDLMAALTAAVEETGSGDAGDA